MEMPSVGLITFNIFIKQQSCSTDVKILNKLTYKKISANMKQTYFLQKRTCFVIMFAHVTNFTGEISPSEKRDGLHKDGFHDNGDLERQYGSKKMEVMQTSVAAATSAALKSKKRKRLEDGG